MLDMNPEIRARWAAALRSGTYRQGHHALHQQQLDGDKFCCLGVLCDLAVKAGVQVDVFRNGETSYDGFPDILPPSVAAWAGLDGPNPYLTTYGRAGELNDGDECGNALTFAEIADLIDGGDSDA
jgi:hypothetical protein